jgi:hypothetical protein
LGLLFAACGEETPPVSSGDDNATGDDDNGSKTDASSMCMTPGGTHTCTCSNGKLGTKTCSKSGTYGSCNCSANTDGGKPQTGKQLCKAGYYTGNFMGKYRPGAFGFGIFPSGFEVDIAGGKSFFDQSLPPLAFSLTEQLEGSGEFKTFTVGGGCMQGLATAVVVTQSPFVAKLTGDLNCETGEFSGMLEGYYTLIGIPYADFSFSGPLTAQFNFDDSSLEDGMWSVREPPAANGDPAGGGEGTWNAQWTADMAPMLAKDPCAEIGPGGSHAPITDDAGQPIVKNDAGTP